MAFAFASMFCYIAASSFVFQQEFGLSPRGYAAVFALNALGMCVGSFVNSRCIDKLGTKKVMLGGLCLALLGNVLLLIAVLSGARSEEHTSELQSRGHLVCRLLL